MGHIEDYKWWSIEEHPNNQFTMEDYLQNHLPPIFRVLEVDGTWAKIQNIETAEILEIHASGDGDFFSHKVEFCKIN
jgi:hypothetical protein